jgi:predicted kinase
MTEKQNILICIGGLPAAGKTSAGQQLAGHFPGSRLICPDDIRRQILGKESGVPITEEDLSPEITARVIKKMHEETQQHLAAGNMAIVASAFLWQSARVQFENLARTENCAFYGFWLEAPMDVLRTRAAQRAACVKSRSISGIASIVDPDKAIDGVIDWQKIDASPPQHLVVKAILSVLDPRQV